MKLFITGVTGFLGYHIANECIEMGHDVLCLKRSSSISLFTDAVEEKVNWVNSNDADWETLVIDFQPEVLIHCAWEGVSADCRNNSEVQERNIKLSERLFRLAPYKQIVVLGSQEEYGRIDMVVNENHPLNPITEYAKAKIATCDKLKEYAKEHNIEWQWIRVFTVYGEKQKDNWLIPSMIKKCRDSAVTEMETTKGGQIYSYLYSNDFAKAISSVVGSAGKSGIYNISSSTPIMLMDLFGMIKQKTKSSIIFKPVLPYREYQSMLIMGDSNKFKHVFGEYETVSLSQGLDNIIETINEGI